MGDDDFNPLEGLDIQDEVENAHPQNPQRIKSYGQYDYIAAMTKRKKVPRGRKDDNTSYGNVQIESDDFDMNALLKNAEEPEPIQEEEEEEDGEDGFDMNALLNDAAQQSSNLEEYNEPNKKTQSKKRRKKVSINCSMTNQTMDKFDMTKLLNDAETQDEFNPLLLLSDKEDDDDEGEMISKAPIPIRGLSTFLDDEEEDKPRSSMITELFSDALKSTTKSTYEEVVKEPRVNCDSCYAWKTHSRGFQESLATTQQELEQTTKKLNSIELTLENESKENENLRSLVNSGKDELNVMNRSLRTITQDLEDEKTLLLKQESYSEQLQAQKDRFLEDANGLRTDLQNQRVISEDLRDQIVKKDKEREDIMEKLDKCRASLEEEGNRCDDLLVQNNKIVNELNDYKRIESEQRSSIQQLKTEMQNEKANSKLLDFQVKSLKEDLSRREKFLNDSRENEEQLKEELIDFKKKCEYLTKEAQKFRTDIHGKELEIKSLKLEVEMNGKKSKDKIQSMIEMNKRLENKIDKVQDEIVTVREENLKLNSSSQEKHRESLCQAESIKRFQRLLAETSENIHKKEQNCELLDNEVEKYKLKLRECEIQFKSDKHKFDEKSKSAQDKIKNEEFH
eukprot:UN33075